MANPMTSGLCPDDKMKALVAAIDRDLASGTRTLDALVAEYPGDPRLHFLKGSLLAGAEDYAGARVAMRRAVDIAPDFAIARFQLGFLLLTSGEPHAAQEAWGPLHALAEDNYLRIFVTGLTHLINDQFEDTIRLLQDGMRRNTENAPMNRDMQLIIDEVRTKMSKPDAGAEPPMSSVDFLLQQSALKPTRH